MNHSTGWFHDHSKRPFALKWSCIWSQTWLFDLWYLAYFIVNYKVVSLSSWWLGCAVLRTSVFHLIYVYSPNWAIRYGLEGPRIESRWGWHFLHPSRSALGPTQPPFKSVPDLFPGGEAVGAWPWPPTPSLYRATKKVELNLFLRWGIPVGVNK